MKASSLWITYRTRFLVQAKQLTTSLAFTDDLGRQHCGSKGDYLVESSDGVLSIAPRRIFEDVYVALEPGEEAATQPGISQPGISPTRTSRAGFPQPKTSQAAIASHYQALGQVGSRLRPSPSPFALSPVLTRKSPQPDRDRHTPSPRLGSM